jgi:membrane protease YdiL (CAAX protease family)
MDPENFPPTTVTEPPSTAPDSSQLPPATAAEAQPEIKKPPVGIANLWHTAVFIVVLLVFSYSGSNGQHQVLAKHGKSYFYLLTIAWEWVMVLYIWLGTRKRGIGLGKLIGGDATLDRLLSRGLPEWNEMKAGTKRLFTVLIDIGTGFVFWLVSIGVLAVVAKSVGMMRPGATSDFQQKIGFMSPQNGTELALFLILSATAGVCEEIIFRGYLQRQFTAVSRSAILGIVAQAIIFGASHGYEGGKRMFLIAVLGTLLGILTYVRGSVKPAMVTHFCQDGIAGIVLYLITKKIVPLPQ